MVRVVAIIPARGGSVSIPKKNIKPLAGRPLLDWVVAPALASNVFAEVYVSTDDEHIAAVARQCGAKVHMRHPDTATNTASTESALVDFVAAHPDYDVLCLIQATSPLVVPSDFQKGLKLMLSQNADSLVTAVRTHRFLWSVKADGSAHAKNYDPSARPRRQDWDGELIENGAFYMTTRAIMERDQCRLGGKMVCLEMAEHTLTELDSLVDWQILTNMVETYGWFPPSSAFSMGWGAPPSRAIIAAVALGALAAGALVGKRLR